MRPRPAARLLLLVLLLCLASPARAQLTTLETDDLLLIYLAPTQSYLAPHVARCFENSLRFERRLFGYTPSEKITVLLKDFADSGNAGASAVPRDSVSVEIEPFSFTFETMLGNERMNTIMNHELVHVTAQDQTAAADRFFRRLFFGKVAPTPDHPETILYMYLTAPRVAAPRWYQEGIAVFLETWMAGGVGRAQGSWDEMVFRSMVRDGSRIYDPLGLASEGTKTDFQVEVNSYLYGTRFMSYLALSYSPEAVIQWVSRGDGSRGYYAFQFEKVFGVPLDQAWRDWIAFEGGFQRSNLEAIRKYPITPYKDISGQALGSVSRACHDSGARKIYAAFNYPGTVAHVGAISVETGAVEKLIDVKDPVIYNVTSLACDPAGGKIFYTTDNHEFRDLRVLDPVTKESATLLKDARVGSLAFDPADRSIWGIRHYNGIATLVRIPYPYGEWKQVYSFPYGTVAYDIDVSPDGRLLSASFGEISGAQFLRVMKVESLLAGDVTPVAEREFGSTIPSGFIFSPDGRYLYGSSYYTGVSNIFRYEVATGSFEAVSNTETGFFRPIPLGGESVEIFRYTGEGFVPAAIEARPLEDVSAITFLGQQVAEKHSIVKSWIAGRPSDVPIESMITRKETYHPARALRLESFYPVVEGYKDFAAYGFHAGFSDPISLNRGSVTASWSPYESAPSGEQLHVQLEYQRRSFRFGYKYNDADFYDLFGPTKTGRKGYALETGYDRVLINDRPRRMDFHVDGAFRNHVDRLPDYQNVAATLDRLANASARLAYSNVRSSLGSVDDEKGHKWEIAAGATYLGGRTIPRARGSLDLGFALPLPHSSIWIRSSAGTTFGDRQDPFAHFFFGGFGNNWVDRGDEKRYRSYYAFPGLDLNALPGRNFARTMIEWNLPPVRFSRAGTPGFYITWARPALFVSGIGTDLFHEDDRRILRNAGSQVDLQLTILHRLDMTLSLGYAVASERDSGTRGEFMGSLKILR